MADHRFVELVLEWLRDEWDSSNYPGTGGDGGGLDGKVPAFVDADDGTSESYNGREVMYDLAKNNAVTVSSSPNRTQEAIGTEFDYSFEGAVEIRAVAAHSDEVDFGAGIGVDGSADFRTLYQEVRRVIHNHRTFPDPNLSGDQHTHTLAIFDESNLSSQWGDLYEYSITATVRGFEELP